MALEFHDMNILSFFTYDQNRRFQRFLRTTLDKTQLIEFIKLFKVKCALKEECIAPVGSKYNGCDYSRRPTFLYSGCHRYEMSAFSIITSQLFNFDHKQYTMQNSRANLTSYTSLDESITEISTRIQKEYESSFMATPKPTGGLNFKANN